MANGFCNHCSRRGLEIVKEHVGNGKIRLNSPRLGRLVSRCQDLRREHRTGLGPGVGQRAP
jgi:hypothetical protein